VEARSGLTKALRPLPGYNTQPMNLPVTKLAALIAHGTNLGVVGMGHSAAEVTVEALQHVTKWFLREETLKAANALLVNEHAQLPLSRVYGRGIASASDGQRFGIRGSSLLAAFYPRYFGYYERAMTIYTHVSDQFSVFSTQAISAVDLELIREQRDQLARVAASLCNRTAPAHIVVSRLGSGAPSNRLAKALTGLGRVVKTLYIMRYVQDEPLRRRVQLQLNRGESRHDLARWLFFANRGEFRSGDYEEIMNKASCLSLLSNAVLIWNTLEIGKIVERLRVGGEVIADEDLARVTPLLHGHVIPNGTYYFNREL
jgi:TnpA family transposase